MSDKITVTISPESDRVRMLVTTPTHDVLKAVRDAFSVAPRDLASLGHAAVCASLGCHRAASW